jgi:hypothetical protein
VGDAPVGSVEGRRGNSAREEGVGVFWAIIGEKHDIIGKRDEMRAGVVGEVIVIELSVGIKR